MKALVVTDQAAGAAGMTLVEGPEPPAAINDVIVEIHASGFVPTEMEWPSTWIDRAGRDRTPSILGHELAGVIIALGYGTTGLWDSGCSASRAGIATAPSRRMWQSRARDLAPLPGDGVGYAHRGQPVLIEAATATVIHPHHRRRPQRTRHRPHSRPLAQ